MQTASLIRATRVRPEPIDKQQNVYVGSDRMAGYGLRSGWSGNG